MATTIYAASANARAAAADRTLVLLSGTHAGSVDPITRAIGF